ncbi:MAG: mannose-1-phosphate guanylyltransferase [Candidatus Pacebacteria bacterium]|nr:mannose-1-phosphate guanylyltransferase [Candidatus Paceibacterota bacterium]
MKDNKHTFAVILAGGGGTRLWPTSRDETPKQFLKLTENRTMMQIAAHRAHLIVDWDKIIVVTNARYLDDIKEQLPNIPVDNIIAEPERRDTAMAMLAGTLLAQSIDPNANVFNLASDHVVTDEAEFVKVMETALEVSRAKKDLVTVGITAVTPSSAFGYIKIDDLIETKKNGLSIYKVANFTEKPTTEVAKEFIATGKYYWNANMYVWSAHALVEAFRKHQPKILAASEQLASMTPKEFHKALPAVYGKVEKISIDYAISEKADNLVLIPGDFGWNDVGDWTVMHNLSHKDDHGNAVIKTENSSEPVIINSSNNLIYSGERLIAIAGVEDLVIVDSKDITLIVPRSKSQDVKKIVEKLKQEKKKQYL